MSGQIQVIKKKTLSDKMHLMSKTLRNCQIKKCVGKLYDPKNDSMCAYGALGFMSGIPKTELNDMTKVLAKYGLDLDESSRTVAFPNKAKLDGFMDYPERQVSLFMGIYLLNDRGYSFNEIADQLDMWADNL